MSSIRGRYQIRDCNPFRGIRTVSAISNKARSALAPKLLSVFLQSELFGQSGTKGHSSTSSVYTVAFPIPLNRYTKTFQANRATAIVAQSCVLLRTHRCRRNHLTSRHTRRTGRVLHRWLCPELRHHLVTNGITRFCINGCNSVASPSVASLGVFRHHHTQPAQGAKHTETQTGRKIFAPHIASKRMCTSKPLSQYKETLSNL